jgi:hypothetical protein
MLFKGRFSVIIILPRKSYPITLLSYRKLYAGQFVELPEVRGQVKYILESSR